MNLSAAHLKVQIENKFRCRIPVAARSAPVRVDGEQDHQRLQQLVQFLRHAAVDHEPAIR